MSEIAAAAGRRAGLPVPLALAALFALAIVLMWTAPRAGAQASADEIALAAAYAPIVRLAEQAESCGPGEPYQPVDVDLLMGNDEVALRGPWDTTNIVAIAPDADDLSRGLPGYHLDFPGETLRPGCTFEEWSERLALRGPSTTYARVSTEAAYPGSLVLQYWFFYVFNDWNNKHEGDWEMIQINFDADTAAEALRRGPREVGYSQHSSAERAAWGDPKMEIVDGTHPVVYPASGSHANFFSDDLYLMRSSAEGVGCDDARGPSNELRPVVATVPTARDDYLPVYGWLGFEGRWGERGAGPFNGPTGPNMKESWTEPITWSREYWRDESFTVPGGAILGTAATDIFCNAIAVGSETLRRAKTQPELAVVILAGLAALVLWGTSRTSWQPSAPLPAARRRRWGRLIRAAGSMFGERPRLFLGIGLLFVPLGLLIAAIQWLVFRASGLAPLVDEAGERNAFVASLAVALGLVFTLLGYAVVQAAVAWSVAALDAGRPATPLAAYRAVAARLGPLVGCLLLLVATLTVLSVTLVLIPVAVAVGVRWSLLGAVAGAEGGEAPGMLRRSAELVRGSWWRAMSIVLVAAAALLTGPVIGVLTLIATGATFDLVNLISAIVYVVALPLAALVSTYLYFDLRERPQAEAAPVEPAGEAPATA